MSQSLAPAATEVIDMNRRFSPQELFALRNFIPIDTLIDKKLMIPSRFSEGFFRFRCPLCSEFQTATNPKTNLARCFLCERNFNTIDLVMIWGKMDFVKSVKYLKAYQRSISNNNRTNSVERLQQILPNLGILATKDRYKK